MYICEVFCVYTYLTTFMDGRGIVCGNVLGGSLPNGTELALWLGLVRFRIGLVHCDPLLDWLGDEREILWPRWWPRRPFGADAQRNGSLSNFLWHFRAFRAFFIIITNERDHGQFLTIASLITAPALPTFLTCAMYIHIGVHWPPDSVIKVRRVQWSLEIVRNSRKSVGNALVNRELEILRVLNYV